MAIIRSKIARQLLAEGGAPRKGFMFGSPGSAEQEASFGAQAAGGYGDYESMDQEGQAEFDQAQFDAGVRSQSFRDMQDTNDDRGFIDTTRGNLIRGFLDRSASSNFLGSLGIGKGKGNIEDLLNKVRRGETEDLTTSQLNLANKLNQAGITTMPDVTGMSQRMFDQLFPGPPKGEGGDNVPIRKLKAPIAEKKEEPKDEFADILKFYGARFARGGSTGFEGSPEMGGRGTEETYGFDQSGPAGDSGDDGGPPTVRGGGTEPPMLPGGRGIDVGALQRQGLTPDEIAAVYGDYYGIDTTPTVAGPLGSGLGSLTPTAPAPAMGLLGTTGTKGTQPTNLDDLRQAAEDVGRAISDPSSPFGQALDFGKAAVERSKMYEDVFKADGGEVRQKYGLGSIVKKAVGAVKKVAKSPIGKLALIGGLGYLGATKTGFGADLLKSFNKLDPIKKALLVGGAGLSLSPFAMQDEEEEKLPTVANTDPEMTKFIDFYGGPRRFAEDGGDIEDAPMKTASMPSTFGELNQLSIDLFGRPYDQLNDSEQEILIEYFTKGKKQGIERATAAMGGMMEKDEMLDLGGKEMDLRGGGFVPLGEYEKKDDVPARLSKNEFVFTADAVRAAGGGSVDKGADVMYKTMKTLENKVA